MRVKNELGVCRPRMAHCEVFQYRYVRVLNVIQCFVSLNIRVSLFKTHTHAHTHAHAHTHTHTQSDREILVFKTVGGVNAVGPTQRCRRRLVPLKPARATS